MSYLHCGMKIQNKLFKSVRSNNEEGMAVTVGGGVIMELILKRGVREGGI